MPFATDRKTLARECRVNFVRVGGPGGQHRNKAETGVRLFHRPSGITVTATERRSQARNRELALQRLAARLRLRNYRPRPRRPTRKPRSAEERRLAAKRHRAQTKRDRSPRED